MISWTWKFDSKATDGSTKLLFEDTLTIEAVDQCVVWIAAQKAENIQFLNSDLRCVEFISIELVQEAAAPAVGAVAQPAPPPVVGAPRRVLYSVDGGATWVELKKAHFIMGHGLIQQLRDTTGKSLLPLKLCVANEHDKPIRISIAVARNVKGCCEENPKPIDSVNNCCDQCWDDGDGGNGGNGGNGNGGNGNGGGYPDGNGKGNGGDGGYPGNGNGGNGGYPDDGPQWPSDSGQTPEQQSTGYGEHTHPHSHPHGGHGGHGGTGGHGGGTGGEILPTEGRGEAR
jgi:hypothetical protein